MKIKEPGKGNAGAKIGYFDGLAPRWDDIMGSVDRRVPRLREIFASIRLSPGCRAIDAGCGTGVLIPLIEELVGPAGHVTAIDPSPEMVRIAKEANGRYSNVDYLVSPLENAALENSSYDAALCLAVIPHLDDIPAGLANIRRALKPGGLLYIFHLDDTETLNRFHGSLDAPVKHDILPGEHELKKLLAAAGFRTTTYIDRPGLNFVESAAC